MRRVGMGRGMALGLAGGLGSGVAGTFAPDQLTGLQLWLHAGTLALNNNDPVSIWSDQSGNARHATQATTSLQPLYKTGVINGRPVVRGDGVDDYLSGSHPGITGAAAWTIYVVARMNARTVDRGTIWSMGQTGGGREAGFGHGDEGGAAVTTVYVANWTSPPNGDAHLEVGVNMSTGFHLWELTWDGSQTLRVYVDGAQRATQTWLAQNISNNGYWLFGPQGGYVFGGFAAATDLAELALYSGDHSAGNRASVRNYLNTRYAIY